MEGRAKNKIKFSILIFIILFVLTISFIIYPLFKNIVFQSEELVSQKERIVVLESTVSNLEKFQNIYQNLDEILIKIDNLLIDSEVPVEFISFLEETSAECSVISEISPGTIQKIENDFWPAINFKLDIIASSSNFLKFMEKLENSPYLVSIQKLTMSRAGEGVKTNLLIKVYSK